MSAEKVSHSEQQARAKLASIKTMVAALQVDYDRLQELRDDRDDYKPDEVPDDFEVAELDDDDEPQERCTCGRCGRSWDNAIVTSRTPAPSARCPFEEYHSQTWAEANADDAQELADMEAVVKEFETTTGRECTSEDDAMEAIEEHPLSIEVRSGWTTLGEWGDVEPEEFSILLCTGGPAVRIRGELTGSDPSRAWLEHQDWGTPWTELVNSEGDMDALLTYARCFCFEMG